MTLTIHGLCHVCEKMKQVVVRFYREHGHYLGICADCDARSARRAS